MRRGKLMKKVGWLYDYEPEWHDPCSCRLNRKRWQAICALRDAWVTLDASHLKRFLHQNFVYGSFSTKKKLGRDEFIKHLEKKFYLQQGSPFAGRIVNLLRGHVQLDYPYAVQMSSPNFIFNPYSTLHIPRFLGYKIIEIYVSPTEDYEYDVSYEKGIVKDMDGKNVDFHFTGILNREGQVIEAKDLHRHGVNAVVSTLKRSGANIDCVDYENDPSAGGILTVNEGQVFVYRSDGRLRQQNRFAKRTCGPLDEFAVQYGGNDYRWRVRAREYDLICDRAAPLDPRPVLSVITCDYICIGAPNAIPTNGSHVNIWLNEIVRVSPPVRSVHSMRDWIKWIKLNDGYLRRLSKQAAVAWREDIYARSAPILLAMALLPVKLQMRLLEDAGSDYLKVLKAAGEYLSMRATALNEKGIKTPGLHCEAKRLLLMSRCSRFSNG